MMSLSNHLAWRHFVVYFWCDNTSLILPFLARSYLLHIEMLPLGDHVRSSPPSLFSCALKIALERRLRKTTAADSSVVEGKNPLICFMRTRSTLVQLSAILHDSICLSMFLCCIQFPPQSVAKHDKISIETTPLPLPACAHTWHSHKTALVQTLWGEPIFVIYFRPMIPADQNLIDWVKHVKSDFNKKKGDLVTEFDFINRKMKFQLLIESSNDMYFISFATTAAFIDYDD